MNNISIEVNKKKRKDIYINNDFRKIRSKYILKLIFNHLTQRRLFKTIKYNNQIKQKLEINLNDYNEFLNVVIEVILANNKNGQIINFLNDKDKD